MKRLLIASLLISLIASCSNVKEKSNNKTNKNEETNKLDSKSEDFEISHFYDSLVIRDSKLLLDPFKLGKNPLKKLSSIDGADIKIKTYENRHIESQVDTSFKIIFNRDSFEVFKTPSENWLIEARVFTNNFKIIDGIYVGMKKTDFSNKMQAYNIENVPNKIQIENLEVTNWINLKFVDDTLYKIEFVGYVD